MRPNYGWIIVSVALVGCGKEQTSTPAPTPTPAVSAAPATPPPATASQPGGGGYLGTLVKSQQTAVKGIDTASLNEEVNLFNAQEGRYPTNLNELAQKKYIGKVPDAPVGMKINYDSAAGKVTVVPQ